MAIGLFTANAFATTYTFSVSDGDWSDSSDWSPNGTPGAGDTAIIPADTTCHVTSNQVIAVLEVESGGTLRMEGAELLIGLHNNATTSTIDGLVTFETVSSTLAVWRMKGDVTFTGSGTLNASKGSDPDYAARFVCSGLDDGDDRMIVDSGLLARGSIELLVDLTLEGTFRVNDENDVMVLGETTYFCEEGSPEILGDGLFDVVDGRLEIQAVDLDHNDGVPKLDMSGGTTQVVDIGFVVNRRVNIKMRIEMSGGTLDVDDDFSSTRSMTWCGGTIRVEHGATFEVN
ncbi:MAG: hypothetical protein EDS66_17280 [Planctomycetota bacterium]|nr:MAG: hypothetical protein EDS66_17280 [Planctomycetota bacterium]MCQ3921884.1 hypothetical protein [Planctomycetota bacterium]